MPQEPPVVILAGPTAAGKTGAAIRLCRDIAGEVVSADAMAVYRRMDIGTAKPTAEERAAVAHHLVDVAEPDEAFDAARYGLLAREAAADILARGRVPVVAGGTGLYIKAMLYGLFDQGASDPVLRAALRREAEALGPAALHERLARLDPAAGSRIHPNDAFRIVRALEVIGSTGKPVTPLQEGHGFSSCPFRPLYIYLRPERELLYERIDRRVDEMMAQGWTEEVRALLSMGFGRDLKSMQSIGYRQLCAVLCGEMEPDAAVEMIKRDTRRLAKRQMTWFKAAEGAIAVDPADYERVRELALEHLARG